MQRTRQLSFFPCIPIPVWIFDCCKPLCLPIPITITELLKLALHYCVEITLGCSAFFFPRRLVKAMEIEFGPSLFSNVSHLLNAFLSQRISFFISNETELPNCFSSIPLLIMMQCPGKFVPEGHCRIIIFIVRL